MSTDSFNLTEFLPYQLSIASNAVSNRIAQVYNDTFGLKVSEWRVMAMLGDAGALTQRELTERTLMDKVAVNRACKVLEQRGLATRLPNERDGRSHHLELAADLRRGFEQRHRMTAFRGRGRGCQPGDRWIAQRLPPFTRA